jgi:hypothetical protein
VAYTPGLYSGGGATKIAEVVFDGDNDLAEAFAWISANGQADSGDYLIVLGKNKDNGVTYESSGTYQIGTGGSSSSTGNKINLKITLRGVTNDIKITRTGKGRLFDIYGNTSADKPELVLADITLEGNSNNTDALIYVGPMNGNASKVGKLTMKDGSQITGNRTTADIGAAVCLWQGATFTMEGGSIDGNTASGSSGGGGVGANGVGITFTMTGGTIENNTAHATGGNKGRGGGVYVGGGAVFNMSGGVIKNNKCTFTSSNATSGGGVYVAGANSQFTMSGNARIINNTAKQGGGVYLGVGSASGNAVFTMKGGSIEKNTATIFGAAVLVFPSSTYISFSKTGGTIYGTTVDAPNAEKANKAANGVSDPSTVHAIVKLNTAGTAVDSYYDDTAAPSVNLNSAQANWGISG